ncbi:MAG: glyoxalase [Acidobacteriaceae bacterium]|nr:glyoxalase [Acidobacteriaceae bacterium]
MGYAKECRSTVIPAMRYQNALVAIEWLCRAFGFEKQAVYMGEGEVVMHAQLTFGNGMVMLGSVQNGTAYSKLMAQPDEIGMRETQSACLIVSDADAVYATAKAARAEIVMDIADAGYGGRGFTCRDLEGHLWSVGTYDPWEAHV